MIFSLVSNFAARLAVGRSGEQSLMAELERRGFQVMATGQEYWLSEVAHRALRFEHDDPMARAAKFMPDLLAYHPDFPLAYWEAKVNTTAHTPNFSIEKACYDEALARHTKGERVIIAFLDTDNTWNANWIQNLVVVRDMSGQRQAAKGSRTPYLLISKTSTLPLNDFLRR